MIAGTAQFEDSSSKLAYFQLQDARERHLCTARLHQQAQYLISLGCSNLGAH